MAMDPLDYDSFALLWIQQMDEYFKDMGKGKRPDNITKEWYTERLNTWMGEVEMRVERLLARRGIK